MTAEVSSGGRDNTPLPGDIRGDKKGTVPAHSVPR